jgi:hypothetical protein
VKRPVQALLMVVLSATTLVSTHEALACSRAFQTFKVRGDFTVRVKVRDGASLEGITVKVVLAAPTLDKLAEELTDKEGKAFFHAMMVSDYWISAERAGVSGTVAKLWPVKDEAGRTEITLGWPAGPIATVQNIAGPLLIDSQRVALVGAKVWLTDTLSGKELGKTITDDRGMFAFQGERPGLYALHIEDPRECAGHSCQIKGTILVEVDAKASDAGFPRYGLIMSSCGLSAFKDDGTMVTFE